jgi:hypothetical protein
MATVITNTDIGSNLALAGSPLKLTATEQLRGQNYIVVYGKNQTPQQNGFDLYSKYNLAKIATPYGQPLSDSNRFTVFVAPGVYVLTVIDILLDTPYIDIISLSGETDVVISSTVSNVPITVATSDIRLRGFDLGSQAIHINSSYGNNYFENIIGGDYNFSNLNNGGDIAGNFKNCVGGSFAFGDANNGQITFQSTFENCTALEYSFGYTLLESNLKNCTASFSSFGLNGIESCTLTDCKSNSGDCFGTNTIIKSSTLTNCSAGSYSFGRTNGTSEILNSTLINCTALEGSFSNYIENSTFLNCKSSVDSFGKTSDVNTISIIINTTFTDCTAGDYSFAVRNEGDVIFKRCTAGIESFGANQANGTYKNCTAGINSFGAGTQGWPTLIAGGQFYNCVAGADSFGTNFANGVFHYCLCNGRGGFLGAVQGGMGGNAYYTTGIDSPIVGTAIYCSDASLNPVNSGLTSTTNNI